MTAKHAPNCTTSRSPPAMKALLACIGRQRQARQQAISEITRHREGPSPADSAMSTACSSPWKSTSFDDNEGDEGDAARATLVDALAAPL